MIRVARSPPDLIRGAPGHDSVGVDEQTFARDRVVQVVPFGIGFFDQFEFPSSSLFFDALLAKDGLGHRRVKLGIDEPVDGVSLAEPLDDICSMFPDTAPQIASDADVKRPVPVVGEDVDARLHAATMMACQL